MSRKPVFYSFHFSNDAMRAQQIRNIGALDGNRPASANEWESIKRNGDVAVQRWIDDNMRYKRCLVVLIGTETARRPWVQYEIKKAWNDGKAIIGVHIHNLRCPRTGVCSKGDNPFEQFRLENGRSLASLVPVYDPNPLYAYREIADNISQWIDNAIARR